MRRIVFLVSLSAVVVGALLFAYARGTQGEQARNAAGQPAMPSGSVVWQTSPNAPEPAAREPSASVKPEAWPDEPFFVRTTNDHGLVVYNMADGSLRYGYPPGLLSADGKRYVAYSGNPKESIRLFDTATGRVIAEIPVMEDTDWQLSAISNAAEWIVLTRIPSPKEKAAWSKANTWHTDIRVYARSDPKPFRTLSLSGKFEVDAVSPASGSLFLIEHRPANNPEKYVIRLYDLAHQTLQAEPLREKTATEEVMTGYAWDGLATPDGQYLLTLYLNTQQNVAFIHTLDLFNRYPVCIFLPTGSGSDSTAPAADVNLLKQDTLSLAPNGRFVYAANAALGVVAEISLQQSKVTHVTTFTPNAFGVTPPDKISAPTARSVLSKDGARLFFTSGWDVWTFDTHYGGKVDGPILVNAPITALAVSEDSRRLYVATAKDPSLPLNDPLLVFDSASGAPLEFPRAATSMNGH